MGIFMQGHNPRTDDFFDEEDPQALAKKQGYLGDQGEISSGGINSKGSEEFSPTGEGYDINGGYRQMGTSAYDKDVDRSRNMGAAGQGRTSVQMARDPSFMTRRMQMGALGMMRRGAEGGMPSRAVVQGRMAGSAALRGGTVAMAGGGLRNMNSALRGTGQAMTGVGQGVADARAGEIGRDTRGLVQGGLQMRAGDIDESTTQARLDAQQRAMNEQRQQQFERRGWDTRNQQQRAAVDAQKIADAGQRDWDAQEDSWDQAERERFNTGLATGAAAGSGGLSLMFTSDSRAKKNMGSLSGLRSKYMKGC